MTKGLNNERMNKNVYNFIVLEMYVILIHLCISKSNITDL